MAISLITRGTGICSYILMALRPISNPLNHPTPRNAFRFEVTFLWLSLLSIRAPDTPSLIGTLQAGEIEVTLVSYDRSQLRLPGRYINGPVRAT